MKRAEQLQKLSREHHDSLSMALRISRIAENGSEEELLEAIDTIKAYYKSELEAHFQHEEQAIFKHIFQQYRDHVALATKLLKEHGFLRILVVRIKPETAKKDLMDFATVLKGHTRTEERELFPLIETLFTDEQLEGVLNFQPLED